MSCLFSLKKNKRARPKHENYVLFTQVCRGSTATNIALTPPPPKKKYHTRLYERRLFKLGAPLLSRAPSLLPADGRLTPPAPFPSCAAAAAAALAPMPISAGSAPCRDMQVRTGERESVPREGAETDTHLSGVKCYSSLSANQGRGIPRRCVFFTSAARTFRV